jgi:hypothetical protein
MKNVASLLCGLSLCPLMSPGQPPPGPPPAQMLLEVAELARQVNTNVDAALGAKLGPNSGALSEKDLQELLQNLAALRNAISATGLNAKIDLAISQVQAARTQADTVVRSAGNRPFLVFDFEGLIHNFESRQAELSLQRDRLAELEGRLREADSWTKIVQQLAPPEAVSATIQPLLRDLLSQWDAGASGPKQAAETAPGSRADPEALAAAPAPGPAGSRAAPAMTAPAVPGLSAAAARILQLHRQGMPERRLRAAINASPVPFEITTDQILGLRAAGFPEGLIVEMLQRDGALRRTGT